MASEPLGSVLVVGGCGFLGYQIVSMLVNEPDCSVSVLSRFLLRVNVVGTQNLLDVSKTTQSIKAFVYTSTSSVHAGSEFRFITEEAPLLNRSPKSNEYAITKAVADTMVLKADCLELRTLCLRFPVIYGERDGQLIPGSLAVLRDKKTHIQLGDNTNLYDSIYVGNAASAHVAAAKALLVNDGPGPKVNGEAFFVTDDVPMPFWDFQRKIWAVAGDKTPLAKVYVIPAWVGMAMATVVELLFWIFTLGQKLAPKTMRRDVLAYAITNRTFCIEKAKERLGYQPLVDTNEGIKRGVEWALQNQARQDLKAAGKE